MQFTINLALSSYKSCIVSIVNVKYWWNRYIEIDLSCILVSEAISYTIYTAPLVTVAGNGRSLNALVFSYMWLGKSRQLDLETF